MNKLIFAFLGSFLLACSVDHLQEQPTGAPQKKVAQSSQKTDKVSEAIDFLNDVFVEDTLESAAPGTNPTPAVSFAKSKIDTIYDLPDENKKPFLQLVVFKPKAYALISVIKNVKNPPVLFYSQAKFDPKNPNPGLITYLQEFFVNSVRYGDIGDFGGGGSGGGGSGNGGGGGSSGTGGTTNVHNFITKTMLLSKSVSTSVVAPLLKTYWHQRSPYNNTIKKRKGKDFLVGCVAVAVGQIMAYHKKNTHKVYDWNKINNMNLRYSNSAALNNVNYIILSHPGELNKETEISKFLYDVAEGVHMKYGIGGSSASSTDAASYFKNSGYNASSVQSYDYSKVIGEIDNKRPVYLSAAAKRTKVWRSFWGLWRYWTYRYYDAHAWVVDGYKIITTTRTYQEDKIDPVTGRVAYSYQYTTTSSTQKWLHMNWGWGSTYQGSNDAWCTYDYWYVSNTYYQYVRQMITVKP